MSQHYDDLDDMIFSTGQPGTGNPMSLFDSSMFLHSIRKLAADPGQPAPDADLTNHANAVATGSEASPEQAQADWDAATPDTTGHLEGEFAVPVEQVVTTMAQLTSHELKLQLSYLFYAEMLRGLNRDMTEVFEEIAEDEIKDAKYFLLRISVLMPGGVPIPVPPSPTPMHDPQQILNQMITGEQQAIVLLKALRAQLGENPMKFTVEQMLSEEQSHLDRLWQFQPPGVPEKQAGASKIAMASWKIKKAAGGDALINSLSEHQIMEDPHFEPKGWNGSLSQLRQQYNAYNQGDKRYWHKGSHGLRDQLYDNSKKASAAAALGGLLVPGIGGGVGGYLGAEKGREDETAIRGWAGSLAGGIGGAILGGLAGAARHRGEPISVAIGGILGTYAGSALGAHFATEDLPALPKKAVAGRRKSAAAQPIPMQAQSPGATPIPEAGSEPIEHSLLREQGLQLQQNQAEMQDMAARLQQTQGMAAQYQQQAEQAQAQAQQSAQQAEQQGQAAAQAQQQAQASNDTAVSAQSQATSEAEAKMRLSMRIQQLRQQLANIASQDPVAEEGLGSGAQAGPGGPVTPQQQQQQAAEQQQAEQQQQQAAEQQQAAQTGGSRAKAEVQQAQRAQQEAQQQGQQAQAATQGA